MPRISDAHSFLSLVAVKKTENKRDAASDSLFNV